MNQAGVHALCGVFGGDADLEGGYAWLTDDAGKRHEIWYPAGWELRFDPAAVLIGPDRQPYARSGDRLCVEGAHLEDGRTMGMVGPVFEAVAVYRA